MFDIFENSVNAKATEVKIIISYENNIFFCSISDNGFGISGPEVLDPFYTTRKTRKVGLGLPLLKKTTEDTGGYLKVNRINENGGTYLEFKINMSHIDAKPFGDLSNAFLDIIFAWPDINLKIYFEKYHQKKIIFNTEKIKKQMEKDKTAFFEIRNRISCILKDEFNKIGIL